jgi:predicted nucleic acid-binding protein
MARKPKSIVLDSWAVMAYFGDEPAGETVERILAAAHEDGTLIHMTVVNLAEVWYVFAREISELDADRSIEELRKLGVRVVDADWDLSLEAAKFKAKNRMSIADCYAAALALRSKSDLLTGDPEFKQIESEIRIQWL